MGSAAKAVTTGLTGMAKAETGSSGSVTGTARAAGSQPPRRPPAVRAPHRRLQRPPEPGIWFSGGRAPEQRRPSELPLR